MGSTNKTQYLELPQWIGTDQPTWLGDMNDAFLKIDTGYNTISGNASSAISQAGQAVQTANNASATATQAQEDAEAASAAASTAANTANSALEVANSTNTSVSSLTNRVTANENAISDIETWQSGTVTFGSGFSGTSFLNKNETLNLFNMAISATTPDTIPSATTLFTLPSNFRPASRRTIFGGMTFFSNGGNSVVSDININTDGTVVKGGGQVAGMNYMRCNLMLSTAQW